VRRVRLAGLVAQAQRGPLVRPQEMTNSAGSVILTVSRTMAVHRVEPMKQTRACG
jgi:hypothetical protein